MDTLQAIVEVFSSMGTTLVAVLFVLIAVILIWLIVRASRRGNDSTVAPHKNRYHHEPEARQTKSPVPPQASFSQQPEASHEPPQQSPAAAKIQEPETNSSTRSDVEISPEPEDSILHRHFEAELIAKKEALAHPYPTDSVLRRHYDTLHKITLDTHSTEVELTPTQTTSAASPEKNSAQKASIIELAIKKDEKTNVLLAVASGNTAAKIQIPQDSVLKRHFISQLQAEITVGLSPRPSDSVLKRHFDGLVQAELEKRLSS